VRNTQRRRLSAIASSRTRTKASPRRSSSCALATQTPPAISRDPGRVSVCKDKIFVAHSWLKRRFEDWLNCAERSPPRDKRRLQMNSFRDVRRVSSSYPTRPVTPEVAGSSPVAPVSEPPGNGRFSLARTANADILMLFLASEPAH